MKQVTTINSAPRPLDWPAANKAIADGHPAWYVLCVLLGGDPPATEEAAILFYALAAAQQRSPATSVYDRLYTAHIYPEPGVAEGQVYEALRDYAAQHATPDPAMVEIKRHEIVRMMDEWKIGGPPSAEDEAYWRNFHAELAKTREDETPARELEQKLAAAEQCIRDLTAKLQHETERADALARFRAGVEGREVG